MMGVSIHCMVSKLGRLFRLMYPDSVSTFRTVGWLLKFRSYLIAIPNSVLIKMQVQQEGFSPKQTLLTQVREV